MVKMISTCRKIEDQVGCKKKSSASPAVPNTLHDACLSTGAGLSVLVGQKSRKAASNLLHLSFMVLLTLQLRYYSDLRTTVHLRCTQSRVRILVNIALTASHKEQPSHSSLCKFDIVDSPTHQQKPYNTTYPTYLEMAQNPTLGTRLAQGREEYTVNESLIGNLSLVEDVSTILNEIDRELGFESGEEAPEEGTLIMLVWTSLSCPTLIDSHSLRSRCAHCWLSTSAPRNHLETSRG